MPDKAIRLVPNSDLLTAARQSTGALVHLTLTFGVEASGEIEGVLSDALVLKKGNQGRVLVIPLAQIIIMEIE